MELLIAGYLAVGFVLFVHEWFKKKEDAMKLVQENTTGEQVLDAFAMTMAVVVLVLMFSVFWPLKLAKTRGGKNE
jgi:hypothetical protein